MPGRLLFFGDPHGMLGPLISAGCQLGPGDAVVCVGDWDAESPLPVLLRPLLERGIRVAWVPGNHDVDTTAYHDNTFEALPGGNIHGRGLDLAGVRLGGLGGTFGAAVWYPRDGMVEPVHASTEAYLRTLRHQQRWRKGLPLGKRAIIFPDDYERVTEGLVAVTEVMRLGADLWRAVRTFARTHRLLGPEDERAIEIACAMPRYVPSDRQAERVLAVLAKCKENGFDHLAASADAR